MAQTLSLSLRPMDVYVALVFSILITLMINRAVVRVLMRTGWSPFPRDLREKGITRRTIVARSGSYGLISCLPLVSQLDAPASYYLGIPFALLIFGITYGIQTLLYMLFDKGQEDASRPMDHDI